MESHSVFNRRHKSGTAPLFYLWSLVFLVGKHTIQINSASGAKFNPCLLFAPVSRTRNTLYSLLLSMACLSPSFKVAFTLSFFRLIYPTDEKGRRKVCVRFPPSPPLSCPFLSERVIHYLISLLLILYFPPPPPSSFAFLPWGADCPRVRQYLMRRARGSWKGEYTA